MRNLNLTHKSIFTDLNGKSEAGKSSFLPILTARTSVRTNGFTLEGQMLMNGQKYDLMKFSQFAAYVRQDNIFLSTLTVEETFRFLTTRRLL